MQDFAKPSTVSPVFGISSDRGEVRSLVVSYPAMNWLDTCTAWTYTDSSGVYTFEYISSVTNEIHVDNVRMNTLLV